MPEKLLKKLEEQFIQDIKLQIVGAIELEWYFDGGENPDIDKELLALILQQCQKAAIPIESIGAENGERQYEIATSLLISLADAAKATNLIKTIIANVAKKAGITALFSAKPFEDQPASGLHVHLSLHDLEDGSNVFAKGRDAEETDLLLYATNGLCHGLIESMVFFTPQEADYARFVPSDEHCCLTYAPTHVSWGGNNRTTAIRVPASTINPNQRHIEHRVPCPDCNPHLALAAMIVAMRYGIKEKLTDFPKIFGNAFDAQYQCPPLPTSLEEAMDAYNDGEFITRYISYDYLDAILSSTSS